MKINKEKPQQKPKEQSTAIMKTKWGTVTATESGITQPRRRINTTNKSNRRDVNTFVVTPHPVSLSQGARFFIFSFVFEVEETGGVYGWTPAP